MDPRLQRRVQRYGWDKAVEAYEEGWRAQLESAQSLMLQMADLRSGEFVLDVACGTGLVTFRAAEAVGEEGTVVGTDISSEMVQTARRMASERGFGNTRFERSDAEELRFDEATFDVVLCGLGLMYIPDPVKALAEMCRSLKPGGRAAAAVWGARDKCGWAEIFPITDARVASEVCPMFFHLGTQDMLARTFAEAGFANVRSERLATTLLYASEDDALRAAFRGGPVALAYSRFDEATKRAVHAEYIESIAACRVGEGYRIPGEFVVAAGERQPLR
jgi:ubiquinone/menaquinone biosynthesis C-methylase UbiE